MTFGSVAPDGAVSEGEGSAVLHFAWVWLPIGGGVLALALWLAYLDRRKAQQRAQQAHEIQQRYLEEMERAQAFQARQLMLLERQEALTRRVEELLDRFEQRGLNIVRPEGRLDPGAITDRPGS